jgi:hypothetical protein
MAACTAFTPLMPGIMLALSLISSTCYAQVRDSSGLVHAQVEVGGWAATGKVQPFWLRANQYGTVPNATPEATGRVGVWRDYARPDTLTNSRKRLVWGFGLNAVTNVGQTNQLLLAEAYGKVAYGIIEFYGGRRRQTIGLGDTTLSSGFMANSGNALPIPKVQLATRGYIPLGFLKSWLAVNAGFAHGWFNVPYINKSYLHQKYLYLRFGKPKAPVQVHLGLNHQVQWGGEADYLIGSPVAVNGKLPSSFKYYGNIILATNPGQWSAADYTSFDGAYRIGNHLGSIDAAIEVRNGWGHWLLYHQHIYEDVSGLLFLNAPDGLTGLRWVRHSQGAGKGTNGVNHIVIEYVSTLDQSGATFDVPGSMYQGTDNYFNHGQYREGWSYLGRSLGTPLIGAKTELRGAAQTNLFFPNNRIQALYVGASGLLYSRLTWTTRLTYNRNYGTFSLPYPIPLNQFSGLLSAQFPLLRWPGTFLTSSVALDQGDLLPGTAGAYIGLTRRW